jgi:hypothetical protein
MDDKIKYGIGIISILLLLSGTYYISRTDFEKSYYCSTSNTVGIFDRLSSTQKTGYYTENNIEKSKTCTNSKWIKLNDYCTQNNIDCNSLLEQQKDQPQTTNSAQYRCYAPPINECEPI